MVVHYPSCSVLRLLLRILTVVYIAVMLLVRVLEFPCVPGGYGEVAVCKSTTVNNTFQDSFTNAVSRTFLGTEFRGYHFLHSVRMAAVELT